MFGVRVIYLLIPFCHLVAQDITAGDTLDTELKDIKLSLHRLARQVMLQQLAIEERVRSEGDSGIKMVRQHTLATNPYLTATFSRRSISSIHDHSNNIRTVGMGEIIAVLNGVEFRTRHNDYRLYQPHKSSNEFHKYDEIEFPEVPPEVQGTPTEQITEMRLWFKAFKEQNSTVRDYRKYFKPVLCYLEGAWMQNSDKINEPFKSDRHHLDAKTWFELQEKIRFTAASGGKDIAENFAFLPTTIGSIENGFSPKFAQWNYRILCHPLKRDLPLNRFRLVDDFANRFSDENSIPQQHRKRSARFYLHPKNREWKESDSDFTYSTGLLDELMYEIPGKDNYVADITDSLSGSTAKTMDDSVLNAGLYHRKYKLSRRGAMGLREFYRGYNDQNMFVAFNTQDEIMPVTYTSCKWGKCTNRTVKASYAIPLEIIYLTPLYKWNPYNIEYRVGEGDQGSKAVTFPSRDGSPTKNKAFNGTNSRIFYQTPWEFFIGGEVERDAADTVSSKRSVLDKNGELRNVSASGTRIFLPQIGDLGTIRLRYPIAPVHDEGSVTRKELEAVKKAFLELGKYQSMLRAPIDLSENAQCGDTIIELQPSQSGNVNEHIHTIILTPEEVLRLINQREELTKYTSISENHNHLIKMRYWYSIKGFAIYSCNGGSWRCWDNHPRNMFIAKTV